MKIKTLSYFCSVVAALFLAACSTYGPAYQGHQNEYMERPFLASEDKKPLGYAVYGGFKINQSPTYEFGDRNRSAEFSSHLGFSSRFLQGAYGINAFGGQFTPGGRAATNYWGIGLRGTHNFVLHYNKKTEWQAFGLDLNMNTQSGSYNNFLVERRDSLRRVAFQTGGNTSNLLFEDFGGTSKFQVHTLFHTGVRHKISQNCIVGARAGIGFSTGIDMTNFGSPEAVFRFDLNARFNDIWLYNIGISAFQAADLNPTQKQVVSFGITYNIGHTRFFK